MVGIFPSKLQRENGAGSGGDTGARLCQLASLIKKTLPELICSTYDYINFSRLKNI
uniref:Uncharacterized protein n=1 Tax=Arundo donax TaxID=35708 RepID=A0A0A9B2F5_ARUDO